MAMLNGMEWIGSNVAFVASYYSFTGPSFFTACSCVANLRSMFTSKIFTGSLRLTEETQHGEYRLLYIFTKVYP